MTTKVLDYFSALVADDDSIPLTETALSIAQDAYPDLDLQAELAAIGGCSGIDIVSILKKQKQEIESFEMTVDGTREAGAVPSPFTAIHIVYYLKGKIDAGKAQRAADLSVEKYCSVATMLEKSAKITYEVKVSH